MLLVIRLEDRTFGAPLLDELDKPLDAIKKEHRTRDVNENLLAMNLFFFVSVVSVQNRMKPSAGI